MASDEHQVLVGNLITYLKERNLTILCAAYPNYSKCPPEDRHEPDVRARDESNDLVSIGEAKMCDDLSSERTKEQLLDYSQRVMSAGRSKGVAVPFYLIVPKSCVGEAWKALRELSLDTRPNVRVLSPVP